MNTTKPAVTVVPAVKPAVTVIPYDLEYERQVRKALDGGTNREGQTYSTHTNVDGHYGR